jgi:hypothetical protein
VSICVLVRVNPLPLHEDDIVQIDERFSALQSSLRFYFSIARTDRRVVGGGVVVHQSHSL